MSDLSEQSLSEAALAERINQISLAFVASRCLQIVADLGVADWIGESAEAPAHLALNVGANADALARVLRLLSRHGIFEERGPGFTHSPLSRLLRTDHPHSQRLWIRQVGSSLSWTVVRSLDHCVMTGEPAVSKLDPPGLFAYLAANPDEASLFNAGMTSKSRGDIAAILRAYDFSRFETIGDIGGGRGHLLGAILGAAPRAKGLLFDQPQVVQEAADIASDRLRLIGGDFFKDVLPACDCYLLMSVIHDWNDAKSIAILKAVRKAAPEGAHMLMCELLLPEHSGSPYALLMDVSMLAITGGRERKLSEYGALLAASGWRLIRAIPTEVSITIVESTAV